MCEISDYASEQDLVFYCTRLRWFTSINARECLAGRMLAVKSLSVENNASNTRLMRLIPDASALPRRPLLNEPNRWSSRHWNDFQLQRRQVLLVWTMHVIIIIVKMHAVYAHPLKPSVITRPHFECSAPSTRNLPFLISDIRAL